MSGMEAIKSSFIKIETTLDCKKSHFEIRKYIKLCWVPGNSYIVWSEMHDKLPRGGFQLIDLPIDETVKQAISFYISCLIKTTIE